MIKRLLFWGNGEIARTAKSYFTNYFTPAKQPQFKGGVHVHPTSSWLNTVEPEAIFLNIVDREFATTSDIIFEDYSFKDITKITDKRFIENWKTDYFFPSVSFQKRNKLREDICLRMLDKFGGDYTRFVSHVHPDATVFPDATYGYSVWIQEQCSIQSGVRIGNGVVVWANSHVGHNSTVEDYAWITTGTTICSSCHIKKGAVIGANSVIHPGVTIGEHAIIGSGSIITKDVPDRAVTLNGRDNIQ